MPHLQGRTHLVYFELSSLVNGDGEDNGTWGGVLGSSCATEADVRLTRTEAELHQLKLASRNLFSVRAAGNQKSFYQGELD